MLGNRSQSLRTLTRNPSRSLSVFVFRGYGLRFPLVPWSGNKCHSVSCNTRSSRSSSHHPHHLFLSANRQKFLRRTRRKENLTVPFYHIHRHRIHELHPRRPVSSKEYKDGQTISDFSRYSLDSACSRICSSSRALIWDIMDTSITFGSTYANSCIPQGVCSLHAPIQWSQLSFDILYLLAIPCQWTR